MTDREKFLDWLASELGNARMAIRYGTDAERADALIRLGALERVRNNAQRLLDDESAAQTQPAEMPPKPAPVWIRVGVVAMALGAGALIPVPAAVMKAINALAARIIGGL